MSPLLPFWRLSGFAPRVRDFFIGAIAVIACLAMIFASRADAKEFPAVGASGDGSFRDVCPAGQFLVGLRTRQGSWMDQLSIICAPVNPDGSTGVLWHGPVRGGDGGSLPSDRTCPARSITNAIGFLMTDKNRQVIYFQFVCRSTVGSETRNFDVGAQRPVFPTINQLCGPDEVAVGLQGRYGKHVNAAGLICGPKPVYTALYDAFKTWIAINKITNATISNGEFSAGFGTRKGDDVVAIASLSKAITATCVARLVDDGKLAYSDTIATRLPQIIRDTKPVDNRVGPITVEQLLRHTSGITANPTDPDINWNGIANTADADQAFVKAAFAVRLGTQPGSKYKYNNVNYAILGLMIKAVAGDYRKHCEKAVLTPHRFSSVSVPHGLAGMGAFGGWEMSARQYANFILTHYRHLSASAERFMQASYTNMYGLGVQVRKTAKGRNIWHSGNWKGSMTSPQEFSSYFTWWDTGTHIVVTMDKKLTDAQFGSLDAALRLAAGIP